MTGLVGVGRGRRDDQIDLVVGDQFAATFAARAPLYRLSRATICTDRSCCRFQPRFEKPGHLVDDEPIAFAESGERAGPRADEPDFDDLRLRVGGEHAQHRRRGARAEAARDDGTASDAVASGGLILDVRIHSLRSSLSETLHGSETLRRAAANAACRPRLELRKPCRI